ncbi:hypothetical protein BIU82_13775 [Arthrobacter sp. SW1]|nr:hypothetical protein BIU82_13775 [Arthrobacter sp. SW1]
MHGLRREEVRALETIAAIGPGSVDRLTALIGNETLDTLEGRGLVSVVQAEDGALLASVFPPLLEDFLKTQVDASRKILRKMLAPSSPSYLHNSAADSQAASALAALRVEIATGQAVEAHVFRSRQRALEDERYGFWETTRSLEDAVGFLQVYWGGPVDRDRARYVFSHTEKTSGDLQDLLLFTMTHAMWLITETGDVSEATALLAQLAASVPTLAPDATAWSVFLEVTYDRVRPDLDSILNFLTQQAPSSDVLAAVKGLVGLYRFNPDEARDAFEPAGETKRFPRFEPLVHGLAMFINGRVDDALSHALAGRKAALRALDQFSVVAHSYVAALSLLHRGLSEEAEYIMGSTFALGRPGFLVDALYNAMLRLASLRDKARARSLGAQAGSSARDVGPLPAAGKGLYDLVTVPVTDLKDFEESANRLIDQQLDHGYIFDAAHTALVSSCFLPATSLLERLRSLLEKRNVAQHDALLQIAKAALDANLPQLEELLAAYTPDGDTYHIGELLRGAAKRHRLAGMHLTSAQIERVLHVFAERFALRNLLSPVENESLRALLTPRENEIALLAGNRSNHEIAQLLGLSVRTIETHISNSLRKTNTASRKQLAVFARGEQPSANKASM